MTILLHAFHNHIVYVYLDVPPDMLDKHFIHKSLVCHPCVLQSKWHDLVTKEPLAHDKCGLPLVCFIQLDLVVSRESIHET